MNNTIDVEKIKNTIIKELHTKLKDIDKKLKLVVYQVGNNPASDIYVNNKKKLCEQLGIIFELKKYDDTDTDKLISEIKQSNNDPSVTGILVQLPLPNSIDSSRVIESIDPRKDVDGLTTINAKNLILGDKCLIPCTALGVMKLLEYEKIDLENKNVTILGRSKLVGLPLKELFLKRNANVTVCHSKTKDIKAATKTADILVVAIGHKHFIDSSYINNNLIVIDVGINRVNGKVYGDCNYDDLKDKVKLITPVPKGVGLLTVVMLVNNIIEAYYLQK